MTRNLGGGYVSKFKCCKKVKQRGTNELRECPKSAFHCVKVPDDPDTYYYCTDHFSRVRRRNSFPDGSAFISMTPQEYRVPRNKSPQPVVEPETGC